MKKPEHIDMRGLLSFYILWILKQRRMCGQELIAEIGRRRDDTPSPGTLYPAINALKKDGLVKAEREDKKVVYGLTQSGEMELKLALEYFRAVYGEMITGAKALERNHSYVPSLKRSSQKDDLSIDYI